MEKQSFASLVEGFRHHQHRPPESFPSAAEVIHLTPWQTEGFNHLRIEPLAINNSPTGSGKSVVATAILGYRLLRDPERKVVITSPQKIISRGFVKKSLVQIPNGPILDWSVEEDLSRSIPEKMKRCRDFLLSPAGDSLPGRILVTTNLCLTRMWGELSLDEKERAFSNTTLLIDEAHHVQSSRDENNQLGALVGCLLDGEVNAEILLATAYFFRGDQLPIISDKHLKQFVRHHVPFDSYWSNLRHLESYSYDFVAYKGTPWEELESLLSESQEPTIFYCPPEGHPMLRRRPKAAFITEIVKLVSNHYPGIQMWAPETSPGDDGPFLIDLSEDRHRDAKIAFIMTRGDQISVIIAVGMFKEGADWVRAARVIDLVPSGSDQDRNQRFGRLMRYCPGKSHVSYYSFVQHVADRPKESQRQHLTELFAHFVASLVLENALSPIRVPVVSSKSSHEGGAKVEYMNLLGDLGQQQQEQIVRECCESLISMVDLEAPTAPDKSKELIKEVLLAHGVSTSLEARAEQVWMMLGRVDVDT